MKRLTLMLALCLAPAIAHAWGLPYALDSLQKAQAVVAKDSSKHVLVFYTSET